MPGWPDGLYERRAPIQFAIKLLPSLTDFAFLMPIAFLFGRMEGVKTLLGDCDTGWHIRTGEWIVANRWVPAHDIFSFSQAGRSLVRLGMAVGRAVGLAERRRRPARGGAVRACLLLSTTFTLLFLLARRKVQSDRGDGGHDAGGGGLFDSLAGAAAPVHAVLPGAVLRGAGAGARRARTRCGACRTWRFCRWSRSCGPTCTAGSSSGW